MSEEILELNEAEAVQAAIGVITMLAMDGYVNNVAGVDYAQWIAELLSVLDKVLNSDDS